MNEVLSYFLDKMGKCHLASSDDLVDGVPKV